VTEFAFVFCKNGINKMTNIACNVPLRNFLGSQNGIDIARSCAQMKISFAWGVCTVLCIGLLIMHYVTQKQQDEFNKNTDITYQTIVVPYWLALLPLVFAVYINFSAIKQAEDFWRTEELDFRTSDMPKRDYLVYRVADDRLKTSSAVSLVGTGFIGSTALFGPFLRADSSR